MNVVHQLILQMTLIQGFSILLDANIREWLSSVSPKKHLLQNHRTNIDLRDDNPLVMLFTYWTKNYITFIFIISDKIRFKWKSVRGIKRINAYLFPTIIIRNSNTLDKYAHIFYHSMKLKICNLLKKLPLLS